MTDSAFRRPVLFLPGLLCDDDLWRDQADALVDIADSTVADLTQDDNVAAMARRALANAPERFSLIALSMGGYVAFEMLRQAPHRVTDLVLLSTSAGADDPARQKQRRAAIESLKLGRFLGVTDQLLPQLIHPSRLGEPLAERVRAMAARVGGDAFIRQQQAILARPSSLGMLGHIQVPTLIGVGDGDRLTPPAEAMHIKEGIAGAKFHLFTDCGHLPPLERPAETNAMLHDWLSARALARTEGSIADRSEKG